MMIISQDAILKELKDNEYGYPKLSYFQKANLYILLANNFMEQANNALCSPNYMLDKSEITEEQEKVYRDIFNSVQELSIKLNNLSKISTRYVQDHV